MFRDVLIGVDERDGGRDALALVRKLTAPHAHLALARVHSVHPLRAGDGPAAPLRAAQIRAAESALARAAEQTGVTRTMAVGAFSTGDGMNRLASERRVDLLAISSGHHGSEGVVAVGDWLAQLLTRAPCAVAIAPAGYHHHQLGPLASVGLAYDGSEESRRALNLARSLAGQRSARLRVLQVPTRLDRLFTAAADGHLVDELCAFSTDVDLLVLGPRAAGPIRRVTYPSATLALAHRARSPLLLVTHQALVPTQADRIRDEEWITSATAERVV